MLNSWMRMAHGACARALASYRMENSVPGVQTGFILNALVEMLIRACVIGRKNTTQYMCECVCVRYAFKCGLCKGF